MAAQLRIYRLNPDRVEEFVILWREQIVPARRAAGLKVQGAWVSRDEAGFAWVVAHSGPGTFEEANQKYYDSEARRAISPPPDEFLVEIDTVMVERVSER
jgi:hypothetical protein